MEDRFKSWGCHWWQCNYKIQEKINIKTPALVLKFKSNYTYSGILLISRGTSVTVHPVRESNVATWAYNAEETEQTVDGVVYVKSII